MKPPLPRWDHHAVHLLRVQGWRNMPEAAAIAILSAARIPFSLLSLTFIEMLEQAGHKQAKGLPWRHNACPGHDIERCAA